MGLDTSHDCWHGAYSSFGRWRSVLCEAAGYGELAKRDGYGPPFTPWPPGFPAGDVLVDLLYHSDCDGELKSEICGPLADRLEALLPEIRARDQWFMDATLRFIAGLRDAAEAGEDVEFH